MKTTITIAAFAATSLAALNLGAAPSALAAAGTGAPAITTDPASVKPGIYQLDPAHGKITWSVNHIGFSTYVGQFSGVSATLQLNPLHVGESKLTASVDINSIGTLNPALDKVLKGPEFFDAAQYPTATFVSTRILRTGKTTANVDGNLTLHGITKPIVLQVTFNQAGPFQIEHSYVAGFEGSTTISRSEFGISAFPGMLSDAIPLQLEGEFHLQK